MNFCTLGLAKNLKGLNQVRQFAKGKPSGMTELINETPEVKLIDHFEVRL